MIEVPVAAIQSLGAVKNITTAHNAMVRTAKIFERRLTAPWVCQSRIIGPNRRCASNHACKRCEPRAAAKAESSTKGTVGRPGTTMPTMPKPRLK